MSLRLGLLALAVCGVLALGAGCQEKSETAAAAKQPSASGKTKITIRPEVRPSVLIEAALGEVHKPMQLVTDAAAANGKYVWGPAGPKHTHKTSVGGDVTLRVSVAEAGEYKLWLRTHWCCACGNSLDVVLDGAELGTVEDSVFQAWHWVPLLGPAPIRLTAGEHVMVIRNREDGSALDQVLLTQDSEYRPTGVELPSVAGRTAGAVAVAAPPAPAPAPTRP